MMKTPTKKDKRLLLTRVAVFQAAVIVLCILVMLLFPDFRFHPIIVLGYAATVLFSNISQIDHE